MSNDPSDPGAPKPRGGKRPQGVASRAPRAAAERAVEEAQALDLVRKGLNFREVAEELGCSVSTAYKRYVDGRNAVPREMAEHIIAEVRETARGVRAEHWAKRGDPESAKVILLADKNILATLPTKLEHTGKDGAPLINVDLTKLTAEQIDAFARGDVASAPRESGDGAPAPSGSAGDVGNGGLED